MVDPVRRGPPKILKKVGSSTVAHCSVHCSDLSEVFLSCSPPPIDTVAPPLTLSLLFSCPHAEIESVLSFAEQIELSKDWRCPGHMMEGSHHCDLNDILTCIKNHSGQMHD
jgi:hypothetical protein